ncbi:MAG: metal ABC transporter permease [Planctomycetia bacterium]|nr:metal ABC transporter permease [Planctomycetia bacterium]
MNLLQFSGQGAYLDWWTIGIAAIVNTGCAVLGCFLVLRKLSLLGDAISHAVLPGIVLAFLLAGRSPMPMLLGAMATGVLTTFLIQTLQRYGGVAEDAGMGIVFTAMFSVGVLLLSNFASQVDLDPSCVLYGQIEYIPLNVETIFGIEVPKALPIMLSALVAVIAFVTLFWKELKLTSFDPALATAIGINATLIYYLLMGMTAVVSVAAFEAVGALFSVAMLIIPPATAHLLTDKLGRMVWWSAALAISASFFGYLVSKLLNVNAAGMMACVAGGQFAAAVVFAPHYGIVGKLRHQLSLTARIAGEDLAALLYRQEEPSRSRDGGTMTVRELVRAFGGGFVARYALHRLMRRGEIDKTPEGSVVLTDKGRRQAESLVRSHRLWEAYLDKNFQLPLDHLHAPAERIEHFIGPELQQQLAESLPKSDLDPHGREIPPSTGTQP